MEGGEGGGGEARRGGEGQSILPAVGRERDGGMRVVAQREHTAVRGMRAQGQSTRKS